MITFQCPNCMRKFQVQNRHAGRNTKCVKCKHPIVVPSLSNEIPDPTTPLADSDFIDTNASGGPNWPILGMTTIISLAVGLAVGFMLGDFVRQGSNDRELSTATLQAKEAAVEKKEADAQNADAIQRIEALQKSLENANRRIESMNQEAESLAAEKEALTTQLHVALKDVATLQDEVKRAKSTMTAVMGSLKAEASTGREEVRKKDVVVTSHIVKKTGGKHRYFFLIKNNDEHEFKGEVEITLLDNQDGIRNARDTFSTKSPIQPQHTSFVYVEAKTGPVHVHGDWGIAEYSYVVKSEGAVVASGKGRISNEYEDLSQ